MVNSKFNPDRTTFLVGAGISSDSPTSLPIGDGLTHFLLELGLKHKSKKIEKSWGHISKIIKKDFPSLIINELPRLEAVIEAFKKVQDNNTDNSISIIKPFELFKEREFNENHLILAFYFHHGCNIVTLNFDDCIEKAYEHLYPNEKLISLDDFSVPVFKLNNGENKIIHLHGIASDVKNLGFTVSKMLGGFQEDVYGLMLPFLKENNTVIGVGYGCVDTMDVNVMMESLKPSNKSKFVFLNYKKTSFKDSVKIFCSFFDTYFDEKAHSGDTKAMLKEIIKLNSQDRKNLDSILNRFNNTSTRTNNGKNSTWQSCFKDKYLVESPAIQKILELQIVNTIRIGHNMYTSKTIDCLVSNEIKEKYLYSLKSVLFDMKDNRKKYKHYYNILHPSKGSKLNRDYNDKNANNEVPEPLDITLKNLEHQSVYIWGENNNIIKLQMILRKILKSFYKTGQISDSDKKILLKIYPSLEKVSTKSISCFQPISTLCVILRLSQFIEALVYGNYNTTKTKKIMQYYADISLVEGYCSMYRHIGIIHYILYRRHKKSTIGKAHYYLNKGLKISRISGIKIAFRKTYRLKLAFTLSFLLKQ